MPSSAAIRSWISSELLHSARPCAGRAVSKTEVIEVRLVQLAAGL